MVIIPLGLIIWLVRDGVWKGRRWQGGREMMVRACLLAFGVLGVDLRYGGDK